MSGIKIYNVGLNGIQLSKGMTVPEFKSWVVSTLGGSSNDFYQSVIKSSDGGYVAVGHQQSQGQGGYDALIVKYDSNLGVISQHGLGGSGNDYYYSVIQSSDGGYVAVGYQSSEGQGSTDALIVKYDSNLDVISQHGLGGSSSDYYYSVIQSSDGGYIAVGYQQSQGQGGDDALIVKYDSNLGVISQHGLGGSGYDYYYSVIQSSDGGYIAVGHQQSQGQGSTDALIVKYDSNLGVISQHGLGGSGYDYYRSVIQSSDGGYIAVGYQQSEGQGGYDALIVKYDSNFNLITQKGLGGSSSDFYQSVIQSNDGGYIAVGQQLSHGEGSSDALIVKLPNDFSLLTGTLVNHSGLSWTTPTLTETTPTLTETTPTLTETTPTLVESSLTLTVTAPSLTPKRSEKQ